MAIPARNLRKSVLIIACLVALAAFLVYLPALRNDFVNWDDDDYVYQNPAVQHPGLRLLARAFSDFHAANWHPLT